MNIDSAVLDVLSNSIMDGNSLKLTGQLDRALYVATNKVLEAAGGKWNRKAQAHIFDGVASEIMDNIILTGKVTDKKQELGYFPTPLAVVKRLLELAEIEPGMLVLEPSAGQGAIAVEIAKLHAIVHCYEIDGENSEKLSSRLFSASPEYRVETTDFLTIPPEKANFRGDLYDRVVMNPPFAKNSAPAHVLHALKLLAPNGRLVSVMPSSVTFRTDRLNKAVRDAVEASGSIEPLPENSFAESGTNVNTVIVTINA
jgi:type I restriction-modification system DNA methylase subunit